MREVQSRVIQGVRYEVLPLPAGRGVRVMAQLAKVIGPGIGEAASLAEAAANIGRTIGAFTERLDPDVVETLCREFAATTTVTAGQSRTSLGAGIAFDEHFAGQYDALLEWLRFCMEVNFGPLWQRLGMLRSAPGPSDSAVAG